MTNEALDDQGVSFHDRDLDAAIFNCIPERSHYLEELEYES